MELLHQFIGLFGNLPEHLNAWSTQLGGWLYLVLFLIVFAETGLVVTPFLPGDSLLFALGALAAIPGSELKLEWLGLVLFCAALTGDMTNYSIGRLFAVRFFQDQHSRFFKPHHVERTREYFTRYGGKTIILARFIPIVRTYTPFVAGLGQTKFSFFVAYSVCGALCWITGFLCLGYFFGNMPGVKTNFHFVILAIIVISALPALIEIWRARSHGPAKVVSPSSSQSASQSASQSTAKSTSRRSGK